MDQLCQVTGKNWPGINIAGSISPPFGDFNDQVELKHIDIINSRKPDILWVGMGCPKQELWAHRYRQYIKVPVIVCVGAAFDFIAGTTKQAPKWLQKRGLEWLFRLAHEPRRLWKRYLFRNPYFVYQVILQKAGLKWSIPEK